MNRFSKELIESLAEAVKPAKKAQSGKLSRNSKQRTEQSMDPYIEHVLDNDGTRYLPYDPAQFTPARMREYADEALSSGAVQVSFVDQDGLETAFERDA